MVLFRLLNHIKQYMDRLLLLYNFALFTDSFRGARTGGGGGTEAVQSTLYKECPGQSILKTRTLKATVKSGIAMAHWYRVRATTTRFSCRRTATNRYLDDKLA